ncbi:MAG: DUF6368 family protein [Myxococcota bacterium]
MSGPAAAILLPAPLDAAQIAAVRHSILGVAEVVDGENFWIQGQPFTAAFAPDYPGELEDIAGDGLPLVLGWVPRGTLTVIARCGGSTNHRLLGGLCLRLCQLLGGVVDFGGTLTVGPVLDGATRSAPLRVPLLGGALYATTYAIEDHRYGTAHYGDARFLEGWLEHPRFRMVT